MNALISLYEKYKEDGYEVNIATTGNMAILVIKEIPARITTQIVDGQLVMRTRCPVSALYDLYREITLIGLAREYNELRSIAG